MESSSVFGVNSRFLTIRLIALRYAFFFACFSTIASRRTMESWSDGVWGQRNCAAGPFKIQTLQYSNTPNTPRFYPMASSGL